MTNEPLRRLKQAAIDMRDSLTYPGFDIGNTERGEVEALLDVIDEFTRPTPDESRPVEVWRPIESAPAGESVLVAAGTAVGEASLHENGQWWWCNNHPSDAWGDNFYPTHWQPLPTSPTASPEVASDADYEAWASAVNDASELFSNAPDQRFASRASRVLTYIKAHRPVRSAGDVDAEKGEFTSEQLNAHLAESYATILDDLAMCRSRTAEGFNLNQAAKLLRHYAAAAPKPAGGDVTEDQFDSAADAYQDVFDGENHRAALRHALNAALAPGGEGSKG